jgi:diaminohydroxyphosphoribosylaminopyrimidine deaminase/5-amino-6-(5-phosphoribosylamino)uracil reductase
MDYGSCLQVFAFVAPKIIGGKNAPSPVAELGMVEMSQALDLIDVCYEQVGVDLRFYLVFF